MREHIKHMGEERDRGNIDTGKGTQTPVTAMTQAAEIQMLKAEIKRIEKENTRLR